MGDVDTCVCAPRVAGRQRRAGEYEAGTTGVAAGMYAMQLFNQAAIFDKLSGQPVDALPYPPTEKWRAVADDEHGTLICHRIRRGRWAAGAADRWRR